MPILIIDWLAEVAVFMMNFTMQRNTRTSENDISNRKAIILLLAISAIGGVMWHYNNQESIRPSKTVMMEDVVSAPDIDEEDGWFLAIEDVDEDADPSPHPLEARLAELERYYAEQDRQIRPEDYKPQVGKQVDVELAIKYGYFEAATKGQSDYEGYDIGTLLDLSESGDAVAQMFASVHVSLPMGQRQRLAESAAKEGYTSALVRLGMSYGMQGQISDQLSQPIPAVKYAYLRAAEELGDPFATQIIINASTYIGELSDEDKSAGDALSKSILERIAQ